ncbi:MAG: DUF3127 domain-containing protein [Deltaproteobacteria bacterium]|nr:MAG: DUF3127 domain-containing protein [Deltaproteobacteria bacterium]
MDFDDYVATGVLYKKHDAQQITDRFRKRELVLELPGRYPQLVAFELTNDRCEALDAFEIGDELKVTFRLRGREWTGRGGEVRYFNSLDVLDLARVGPEPVPAAAPTGDAPASDGAPPPSDDDAPWFDDDDIPF